MIAATGRNDYSSYTEPQLAEGWVQRILNSVTPFAQRMRDFENYRAELSLSMPMQIGGPYEGDVALNNDNLANVGLIQLYQTVLNKAESFSIGAGISDPGVNAQLLLAADRLGTLYSLLGDEAYSDAKNPTIAVGDSTLVSQLAALPTTAFCFAGEVPTLLDEELALLRGRSYSSQISPDNRNSPYYNRLYWNFTKDIAGGEPAYVVNYNIRAVDGVLGAEQAAKQYPQGHGDAWGHYLSAVKGYYRLLRNPVFGWGDPATYSMTLAERTVTTDSVEEQKLATAAANLVKTGLDVTDLTCRKQYRDENGASSGGYFDNRSQTYKKGISVTVEQGFGYGEVATKTALAAFYNWATVNSLLPADATNAVSVYSDQNLDTIDRGTVTALKTLASGVRAAETKLNNLDAGLNPLGLSQNAVPFDLDPTQLAQKNSHYDQIRERAGRALDNADTLLAYANEFGSRIRAIENYETEEAISEDETEAAYKRKLIVYYGTPFAGDIGAGKTYQQGYDGPDYYNYMMMDLNEYGLSSVVAYSNVLQVVMPNQTMKISSNAISTGTSSETVTLYFSFTSDGLVAKTVDGVRQCEGSIQAACRQFLTAYVNERGAQSTYEFAKREAEIAKSSVDAVLSKSSDLYTNLYNLHTESGNYLRAAAWCEAAAIAIDNTLDTEGCTADSLKEGMPTMQIFGMSTSVNLMWAKNAVSYWALGIMTALNIAKSATMAVALNMDATAQQKELEAAKKQAEYDDWDRRKSAVESYIAALENLFNAEGDVETTHAELLAAYQAYRTQIAEAQLVVDERTAWRKARANIATQKRYEDMYLRVQRNAALSQYETAFDTAQRYVWQLAKVYDYETGLLSQDSQAGAAFLGETVATRSLGKKGTVTCASTAGGGLWDIVKRMDDNWAVLKPRLGVNNPDEQTKWFSMRYSLFRIRPDAAGDEAWRQELAKYWCDDILSDDEFRRYCEKPVSDTIALTKVPGLVIPFSSAINAAENFFGRTLQGGETAFSSTHYATKIAATAVSFVGYDKLVDQTADGLANEPEVYLVPVGSDHLRAPIDTGKGRTTLSYTVVDQVLPLPYAIGAVEAWNDSWFDSAVKIRRHAAFPASDMPSVSRLVGRSVWNDRWLLIIPATSLNGADPAKALRRLVNGVGDIRIGIRAYSRQGN